MAVIGGGDSAIDAAAMVLERNGHPHVVARSEVLRARADMVSRVRAGGGVIHAPAEIEDARFENDQIGLVLSNGGRIRSDLVIVQIGFLSAKECSNA